MLQQTQVATALPYYERWLDRFPTLEALAAAAEQEVLSCWQGLGYYSRCRNLHEAAKRVVESGFPTTSSGWRGLPGIGAYTAAAIASITVGEPVAAIDGNVERVYARFAASDEPKPRLLASARSWSERHMGLSKGGPAEWNQALMELGARVCTPRIPDCRSCPLAEACQGQVEPHRYPAKKPPRKIVEISYTVWVPAREGRWGVRRIPTGGWWAGLWEFPRRAEESDLYQEFAGASPRELGEVRHQVTHHRLTLRAFLVDAARWPNDLDWLDTDELKQRAMPAPQRKIANLAMKEVVAANGLEPLT